MLIFIACALSVLGLPLLLATSARMLASGSAEFRARVLEAVAAAVHRGIAVEPQFLWLVAHDSRGRRRRAVLRAAQALDEGETLAAALSRALRLPPATSAAIAAADGTPHLDSVLREAAGADRAREDFRHQLLLRLAYPALVLSFLGGFLGLGIGPKFVEVCASMDVPTGGFLETFEVARSVGLGLLAVTILVAFTGVPWVRSCVGRAAGLLPVAPAVRVAAWLQTLASAVRAGRPLDEALERSAPAIGHPRHAHAVRDAARRVSEGTAVEVAWAALPLPAWLRARAPMLAGTPELVADTLRDLATLTRERSAEMRERLLHLLAPLLLTTTGAVLCLVMLSFFRVLQTIREAMLW